MKEKLQKVWGKLVRFFSNRKVRDLQVLLAFEITKRKELEFRVNSLELENRRIKFDINRTVNDKIENYEQLFTASKQYGDNLIKVAIKAHEKINRGDNKR